jgi:hypothetical protein
VIGSAKVKPFFTPATFSKKKFLTILLKEKVFENGLQR